MERNQTALARKPEPAKENTTENTTAKAKVSTEKCNKSWNSVEKGLSANKQSREQLELAIAENVADCANHAREFGDYRLMDRLVHRLVIEGDIFERPLGREVISWCKQNTPIRWDAKGKAYLSKEGDSDYKPYVENPEMVDPFYKTAAALRARKAAEEAAARALNPIGVKDLQNRVLNLRKWFENAGKADDKGRKRGYVSRAEKLKMLLLISGIEAAFNRMIGEDAAKEEETIEQKLGISENKQQAETQESNQEASAA